MFAGTALDVTGLIESYSAAKEVCLNMDQWLSPVDTDEIKNEFQQEMNKFNISTAWIAVVKTSFNVTRWIDNTPVGEYMNIFQMNKTSVFFMKSKL